MAVSYELVHVTRSRAERVHPYTSEEPLEPGSLVHFEGRDWLVESVDGTRVSLKPARYRLKLRHPDGREELGALRRYATGAPGVGHTLSTVEDGAPASWQVVDEQLARDQQGEPYLELTAERDFSERDEPPTLPEHELEHAFARDEDSSAASATLARADEAGLYVELVALEPGEAPDWAEAEAYIDALELEEIDDDLLVRCGVDPDRDPRESWIETVRDRLRSDLERFRDDVEGDQDEIEEWEFRDGRVFAAVGSFEDEANPDSGHGWMTRLVDAGALAAAGFTRIRKAELQAQPTKLAAFEGLGQTRRGAPVHLLGWYKDGRVEYGIPIPRLLSLLAYHDPNATVAGLDAVPADERPPVNVVRIAFQTMVGIGTMLALLGCAYLAVRWRRKRLPESPWFYRALVVAGPLSVVALICGWVTTEVGRQPWVVYRVMRTSEAVTGAGGIPVGYATLALVYLGLALAVAWILRRLARVPLNPMTAPPTAGEV